MVNWMYRKASFGIPTAELRDKLAADLGRAHATDFL